MARRTFEWRLRIGVLALFVPPTALAIAAILFLRVRGDLADPSVLAVALVIGGLAMSAYLAVTAGALGRAAIRSIRAVRQGTELMATVNPDHRLEIRTGDEIEDLAEDVNRLADRWAATRRALAEDSARAASELRGACIRLEAILDTLDEGVLVVTGQGKIALANRAASELLGPDRPLLGSDILELISGEPLIGYLARARRGEPVRVRASLRGPHGPLEGRICALVLEPRAVDGLVLALRGPAGRAPLPGVGLVSGEATGEPGPERSLLYDFSYFETVTSAFDPAARNRRLAEATFAVLDTETTGLRPLGGDRVVSVAVVLVERGRVRAAEPFDSLVNPGRPIPASSTRFHGITDAMVVSAPPIGDVLVAFQRFVGDSPLVGHEIAFDLEFLDTEARRSGLPPLGAGRAILDTRLISYLIHGPDVSHSLEAVAQRLGVTNQARHSALGDALATAEILVRLLELAGRRGIDTVGELVDALKRERPHRPG